MRKKLCFIDFETQSVANLKRTGVDIYAKHPTTNVLCLAYAFDDGPVCLWRVGESNPIELFNHIKNGGKVIAHNATFEWQIWNKTLKRLYPEWPLLPLYQIQCTMVMSYALGLPGSLENSANAVALPIKKDSHGHRVMLQLSQPRKGPFENCPKCKSEGVFESKTCDCVKWWTREDVPEKFSELEQYCMTDVETERALFKRLLPLSDFEKKLWLLDQKINEKGIQLDIYAAKKALELADFERKNLDLQIQKLTNNAVSGCQAVAQIKNWIETQGIKVESLAKADVTSLLDKKDLPNQIRKVLELRQAAGKSSVAKLQSALDSVSDDGRVRGCFQYYGAQATGRWAGRRVQLQNLPRPKISQKEIEMIFGILEK